MAFRAVAAERAELTGDRSPSELCVAGGEPGVLAFHGFGGTPFEVELALDAAADVGLSGRAPLVAGHGTQVASLAKLRFEDWVDAAERELLREPAPRVLAGLSLGTLLCLELALRQPARVRALILLANALSLAAPFPRWALQLAHYARLPDWWVPKGGPDLGDPEARKTHVSYTRNPVHAATEVWRGGAGLGARLKHVTCPTLILHGARDRVCPVANAWRLAQRLGSSDCRVVIFPNSHHILTRDREKLAVRREMRDFLGRFV